ncbi:MAG: nitroreductase family protein [Planctomycetota bacterium]|jgi:nitroreductase|nr:nitroreductase family protein [Planctomycetota bacterium]
MDFFQVVRARRSVREFSPTLPPRRPVEDALDAARLAPSASNAQPWRLLVARSPELLASLAAAGYNQKSLVSAPLITVLLGDRGVYRKRLRRAKELVDLGALQDDEARRIETLYKEHPPPRGNADPLISRDCMLAGEHYVLALTAGGLATCWVGLFDPEQVLAALGLDAKVNFPVALIPTGYPVGEVGPPRPRYGLAEVAWDNAGSQPWVEGGDWSETDQIKKDT